MQSPDIHPTSPQLAATIKAGEERAFEQLVRAQCPRLHHAAVQMLGQGADADDAVQETLIRAYHGIGKFKGRSSLSTWLRRILINMCVNRIIVLRHRRAHEHADALDPALSDDGGRSAQQRIEMSEDLDTLCREVESLPAALRGTTILGDLYAMRNAEVAKLLSRSKGAVNFSRHAARTILRRQLERKLLKQPNN